MWEDPFVAEVRRVREQILAEFDYDIQAYAAHIIAIQEEKKRRGFEYTSPASRGLDGCRAQPTGASDA